MKLKDHASPAQRTIQCATTLDEVERAWSLVYDVYLAQRIIHSNPFRIHVSPSAVGRQACVVHDSAGKQLISTMTIIRDSSRRLPLDRVARDRLNDLRAAGRRLVETGMLAVQRAHWLRRLTLLFGLMRWAAYFTLHEGADDIVIGVHPHHVGFYVRGFGFEPLTPVMRYSALRGKLVVVLRLRLRELLECGQALPRGLVYVARHPVSRGAFTRRYRFPANETARSALGAFLWHRTDDTPGYGKWGRYSPVEDREPLKWNDDRAPVLAMPNVG